MKLDIKKSIFTTAVVFVAHYFSGFLEDQIVSGNMFAWFLLFLFYSAFIGAGFIVYDYLWRK